MALFFAAFRRDLVSLLRFPFLSHVHVFSCAISRYYYYYLRVFQTSIRWWSFTGVSMTARRYRYPTILQLLLLNLQTVALHFYLTFDCFSRILYFYSSFLGNDNGVIIKKIVTLINVIYYCIYIYIYNEYN